MALQNLRDKLLKAGLVDKKQKQQVDLEDRKGKKQKGESQQAAEEAERQRQFAERQAAEAEEQRRLEAERAAERAQHELAYRVRNICDRWAVRSNRPGKLKFFFVQRRGRIGYLLISDLQFDQLLLGGLALVERLAPEEQEPLVKEQAARKRSLLPSKDARRPALRPASVETHVLIPPEPAAHVLELDAAAVRFWARKGQPIGFLEDPPA